MAFLILALFLPAEKLTAQLPWPVEPTNIDHPIGNCCGEFQEYGLDPPYMHTGIDIREDCAPNGPWIRSVTGGPLALSIAGVTSRYNGVTIVTGTTTYRYWHLDYISITQDVRNAHNNGTAFPANTRISQIVDWTATWGNFHHLHFDMARGGNFINPLSDPVTGGLTPEADWNRPEIEEILICRNNSNTYLPKPVTGCWIVDGDLDILARLSDTDPQLPSIPWQGHIGVYRVEYSITELSGSGTHNIPPTQLYQFDTFSTVGNGGVETSIIFKNYPPDANSESDYWANNGEQYYYIVTNVNSSGDLDEANGYWDTDGGGYPDGMYEICVTAHDFIGNSHTLSEVVCVENNPFPEFQYEYAVKLLCGDQKNSKDLRLVKGLYATSINIHNPNDSMVVLYKKLALTYPPGKQEPGKVIPIGVDTLWTDQALETDCMDIKQRLFPNGFPTSYIEGFVIIKSTDELDVTPIYTTAKPGWFIFPPKVASIDIEPTKGKRIITPKLPDLVPVGRPCCSGGPECFCNIEGDTLIVRVRNQGSAATATTFETEVDFGSFGKFTKTTKQLEIGETAQVKFIIPFGCYDPDCDFKIKVDATMIVPELDETNNIADGYCLG